ncbi:MAG TPA: VOC family protein [Flavipsychrobacter sp.]|nr:VOC family protein [Flavipsychrobacter sp.]
MASKVFINLPVKDLNKSIEFFKKLGYSFNEQFTDETAACLVISEEIYAMLLTHDKFKEFIVNPIADATQVTQVINALSVDSKEAVNEIADKALNAGATAVKEPLDYGFMYSRLFADLDGHYWEFFWMDPNYVHQPVEEAATSTN